jgi:hypothetical protein
MKAMGFDTINRGLVRLSNQLTEIAETLTYDFAGINNKRCAEIIDDYVIDFRYASRINFFEMFVPTPKLAKGDDIEIDLAEIGRVTAGFRESRDAIEESVAGMDDGVHAMDWDSKDATLTLIQYNLTVRGPYSTIQHVADSMDDYIRMLENVEDYFIQARDEAVGTFDTLIVIDPEKLLLVAAWLRRIITEAGSLKSAAFKLKIETDKVIPDTISLAAVPPALSPEESNRLFYILRIDLEQLSDVARKLQNTANSFMEADLKAAMEIEGFWSDCNNGRRMGKDLSARQEDTALLSEEVLSAMKQFPEFNSYEIDHGNVSYKYFNIYAAGRFEYRFDKILDSIRDARDGTLSPLHAEELEMVFDTMSVDDIDDLVAWSESYHISIDGVEKVGKLQSVKNEWNKFGKDISYQNFFNALGESIRISWTRDYVNTKDASHADAELIDGLLNTLQETLVIFGGIADFNLAIGIGAFSRAPGISKLIPQSVKDWGEDHQHRGIVAMAEFASLGTPDDWQELALFLLFPAAYQVAGRVEADARGEEFNQVPDILERIGGGIKEQVVQMYAEKGYFNGTMYAIGNILPLVFTTKGAGSVSRSGKVADDVVAGVRVGAGLSDDAVGAAKLVFAREMLEDLVAYKNAPVMATPGVPGTHRMPWDEFRELRKAERIAATSDDIAGSHLSEPRIFKRGSREFTLEQGNSKSGWQHIFERHIDKDNPIFSKSGRDYFDNWSESQICDALAQTIKHGDEKVFYGQSVFDYRYKGIDGQYQWLRATVWPDGRVQSFHPLSGSPPPIRRK